MDYCVGSEVGSDDGGMLGPDILMVQGREGK